MTAARLLSLLIVGGSIAWLIRQAVAELEDSAGSWQGAAPWFALIFAVAVGYALAFDRFVRRKR